MSHLCIVATIHAFMNFWPLGSGCRVLQKKYRVYAVMEKTHLAMDTKNFYWRLQRRYSHQMEP